MSVANRVNKKKRESTKLMANSQDKTPSQMFGWLTQIGRLRDILLVAAGATYILGYLTWSFHAWKNGLGMLPALEAQYFVAGFIPLLILVLVSFAFWGTIRFRHWFRDWKSPVVKLKGGELTLKGIIYTCIVASSLLYPILSNLSERYDWLRPFSYGLMAVFFVGFVFLTSSGKPEDKEGFGYKVTGWAFRLYQGFATILVFVLLFLLGYFLYAETVYPNIPQEFGGVRPRSAYLDIVLDQASSETLQEIVPNDAVDAYNQVVRSNMVDVYYSGHDVILVKPYGLTGRETPTYEIRQSIVKAVTWCSQSSTVEETVPSEE